MLICYLITIYHESFKIQNTKGRNLGRVGGLGLGATDGRMHSSRSQGLAECSTATADYGDWLDSRTTAADCKGERVFSCFLRVSWVLCNEDWGGLWVLCLCNFCESVICVCGVRVFSHLVFFLSKPIRFSDQIGFYPTWSQLDRVYKISSDWVLFTTWSDPNLKFFKSGRVEYFAHSQI